MERAGRVALAAFVVADIFLVALAWRHTYAETGATPVPTESFSAAPADAPDTGGEPVEDDAPQSAPADVGPGDSQYLAGVSEGGLLVRAPVRGCGPRTGEGEREPLEVAVSDDGGRSFDVVPVGGLATVTGVFVGGSARARLFGADEACASLTYETTDGGRTWRLLREPPAFWAVVPRAREVSTPRGVVGVPCRPRRASGVDAEVARVWCADGKILGTSSAGAEWVTLGRVKGAESVVFTAPETGYALVAGRECDGLGVTVTNDGGSTWRGEHCSPVEPPATLAAADDTVMVVGGDAVEVSADGGRSWTLR